MYQAHDAYILCKFHGRTTVDGKRDRFTDQERRVYVRSDNDMDRIQQLLIEKKFKPIELHGFEGRKELGSIRAFVEGVIKGGKAEATIDAQAAKIKELEAKVATKSKAAK